MLVFTCSYEIEVNYLLPNCEYKNAERIFVWTNYCVQQKNEALVRFCGKNLWYDTENRAVHVIQ